LGQLGKKANTINSSRIHVTTISLEDGKQLKPQAQILINVNLVLVLDWINTLTLTLTLTLILTLKMRRKLMTRSQSLEKADRPKQLARKSPCLMCHHMSWAQPCANYVYSLALGWA